jgi:hypothetical protein
MQQQQQKVIVQQRLVAYDTTVQLRDGLKKKIRPLTTDPAQIPIAFFMQLIEMDSQFFVMFKRLCTGFVKHLKHGFEQ